MAHYFVNNDASASGFHEVHLVGCLRMPTDKRYLGNFNSIGEAMIEARKDFWLSSGCDRCAVSATDETTRVEQLKLPFTSRTKLGW
jgi:hypothetical protein